MLAYHNLKKTLALAALLLPALVFTVHAATLRFTYDSASGQTDADYPGGNYIHYTYDAAGNITRVQKVSVDAASELVGDVFADQLITLKDAIVSLQVAGGMPAEGIHLRGDVNGDTSVDLADALIGLKILALMPVPPGINLMADVDGDGCIGPAEIAYILWICAGSIP